MSREVPIIGAGQEITFDNWVWGIHIQEQLNNVLGAKWHPGEFEFLLLDKGSILFERGLGGGDYRLCALSPEASAGRKAKLPPMRAAAYYSGTGIEKISQSIINAKYHVWMSDGSEWAMPMAQIALHRAIYFARDHGGSVLRSLVDDTLPLFGRTHCEVQHWARTEMVWDEVKEVMAPVPGEPINFDDCWKNAESGLFPAREPSPSA
jgi:hypothetical protein